VTNEFDFHDGFVDGVLVSDSTARVFLRSVTGEDFTLVLAEVDALRVDDLKKGNIIFELRLLSPDQLDQDFVFQTYEYSDEHKKSFVLQDWVGKAKEKGLTAIEITPSYGCRLSALFRSHTIAVGHVLA
jgi:hypothetical protein